LFNAGKRFALIYILFIFVFAIIVYRLFDMQLINGGNYSVVAGKRIVTSDIVEEAPRGEITDRYGELLVSNRIAYSVELVKVDTDTDEFNEVILDSYKIITDNEKEKIKDTFPFSKNGKKMLISDEEKEEWIKDNDLEKFFDGDIDVYESFLSICEDLYDISDSYTDEEKRIIAGVRYEAEKKGISPQTPYEFASDISLSSVLKFKERKDDFPGIIIKNSYIREYFNDGIASHILGMTGKMNEDEYELNKEKGYAYNDIIGKQGIEKMAEEYLRGTDGVKRNTDDESIAGLVEDIPAIPGDNVILTIDMRLQRALEESLEKNINRIRRSGGVGSGKDADSGAAVVIDVKTGDVLACASYPTFDLATFSKDYSKLASDSAKPLWNRAISGTYTPGSTFKPLVAISALETGNIKPGETITDNGIYDFYEDYKPRCWIWSEYESTHGSINVSKAIEQSCNYFFYETGRRTGIDNIDEFGGKFGLGEYTGIGLPEEVKGYMASPESKKKLFNNASEQGWYGADTLQASIGQSVHSFTPVQIANYIATIANGGTRYKLNIIKSIRSSSDGSLKYKSVPEIAETINMSEETLEAVRVGMKNVVDEGSARAIFTGYPIAIGGKTGTAQIGKKQSNNALFAAYAPYDNPEIAICVVLEHGVRGSNAAYVAKDLFDEYFGLNEEAISAFNEMNNLTD